ncbi:helix-turn-helix domain-containing protein [Lutispora saccharofermentans]|uniref:XRE family transcriptional regulator n=1 Tax=Lutispora saccharofermentans TaxID=3024236 RepID=A0ABT1NKR5_9FIRM|nr:XRE family transcriptional regulator [Lutispora saccharofermentans]MCQ1531184.1 XRE family transcriptional regulator [Lutispora saccharofermentans]
MNLNAIIAANLKRLRMERNLSLGQLAELSGVSKVMLGQIEKGDSNPTINMLWKIANGLKVPYTVLLDEQENDSEFISRDQRKEQQDLNGHYRIFRYYNSTPRRNFELFMIELDAGTEYASVGHSEKSQEYLIVLEGSLCLKSGENEYNLSQEDSICFFSANPHTYINTGDCTVKAILINYYPS